MTQDRRHQQTQLPKGAKIYLPDEAAQKRRVEAELLGVFRKWGYRDIVTSAYEYFDVVSQGTDQDLQERMFKMVDRESGRLLALRADVTPQIARIVATRMREEPKPLRLAYLTNVFRYDEPPRELRSVLGRKDISALERIVAGLGAPAAAGDLPLALPGLYGRGDVLDRAERL